MRSGNGSVDREEWERGVTMLNERLPPERLERFERKPPPQTTPFGKG